MDRRRLSYASVAGGTPTSSGIGQVHPDRSGTFAHLMNPTPSPPSQVTTRPNFYSTNSSDHLTSIQHPYNEEGTKSSQGFWAKGISAPAVWGTETEETQSSHNAIKMAVRPSYLEGSSYLERLDAVYKAKTIKQKEAGQRTPGQSSLSTSSSSVSLHKIAPSHRGMTYEIVENQPPEDEDGIPPLPSKWAEVDRYGGLEISAGGIEIKYTAATKSHEHEAAAARSDFPIPYLCGIYYYEVSVLTKGKDG
jgi:Ran-binding protein 9/10